MVRFVLLDAIFFLLPFGAYALWLLVTRRTMRNAEDWQARTIVWLALAGAALMLAIILYFIHFDSGPPGGVYVPPHIENGVIVPGHIEPESPGR